MSKKQHLRLFLTLIIGFMLWHMNVYAEENFSDEGTEGDSIVEESESVTETIFIETQESLPDIPSDTESEIQSEAESEVIYNQNLLKIDDENIYDGMAQAYKNGYEPVVVDGTATVILPLYLSEDVEVSEITVQPDFGTVADSPFIIRNYQKTIRSTWEKINGTSEEKEVFLVRFDFPLEAERYNGTYPVILSIEYNVAGISTMQKFTTYIHITDGQSTEMETEPIVAIPEEPDPTSEPKLIITGCQGIPDKIVSGDTFSFKILLKNTNKLKYVQNMTITVSCDNPDITLQADSNVFFFEYLGVEDTLELPLSFICAEKTAAGKYGITLDMSYDNPDAISMTSSGKVEVSISQKIDMDLEIGGFVKDINAGDWISIPVQVMNLGRCDIYNVRCSLDVPGLSPEKSLFLGNMTGGSALSGEIKVFAGMVHPEASDENLRYGNTSGNIVLIYEDENGEEYNIEESVDVNINPLKIDVSQNQPEEKETDIKSQLMVGIVIVFMVIVIGTAVPIVIHRRKIKKLHEKY